jgi:hypothetical protein
MERLTEENLDLLDTVPESKKQYFRERRQIECFNIADRAAWYDGLTAEQKQEVQAWRKAWLDVTETMIIPTKPSWIK